MADCMIFPETVEEFIEQYKFKDNKEIYTNGVDLIPVFRIKQWMYHHMTPTADVEEVRHGKWIESEDDYYGLYIIKCSLCREVWCFEVKDDVKLMNYNYCPNCGARMDGDTE